MSASPPRGYRFTIIAARRLHSFPVWISPCSARWTAYAPAVHGHPNGLSFAPDGRLEGGGDRAARHADPSRQPSLSNSDGHRPSRQFPAVASRRDLLAISGRAPTLWATFDVRPQGRRDSATRLHPLPRAAGAEPVFRGKLPLSPDITAGQWPADIGGMRGRDDPNPIDTPLSALSFPRKTEIHRSSVFRGKLAQM
jgi:hypothetical protein